MNVAVLGASDRPERYSYQAVKLLAEKGHRPFPVHPRLEAIDGIKVYRRLSEIPEPVDTITVYLSPANAEAVADEILASGARRLIFPPGAENPELARRATAKGMDALEACPLVMLRTGQF